MFIHSGHRLESASVNSPRNPVGQEVGALCSLRGVGKVGPGWADRV
jgi:hypothetical protein